MTKDIDIRNRATQAAQKGFTRKDELYLEAAESGMSPEQIGKMYGTAPETVALRIKYMLRSQDIFTDYERKQLLLNSAYRFKTVMDKGINDVIDDPKLASNYMKMIEVLAKLLKDMGEVSARELAIITEAQSNAIIGAVERAYYSISGYLKENHPEVDTNMLNAAFRKAVQEGLIPANDEED